MTLDQLNARMKLGVARPDLTVDGNTDYSVFLNTAQREICKRRSWKFMKASADVTIPAGQTSVALPANFKELTRDKSPVQVVSGDAAPVPVDVWTMEKLKRRVRSQLSTQTACAVDFTFSPPKLETLIEPSDEDLVFEISHYKYLDDLGPSNTSNALTNDYPEMLLARAKSLAFAAVNDDAMVADMEKLFEKKFGEAAGHDAYSALAGIDLRM